jgi:hypothetical protein
LLSRESVDPRPILFTGLYANALVLFDALELTSFWVNCLVGEADSAGTVAVIVTAG